MSWWQLYLIVSAGLGLMLLDARARFSAAGHEATECAVLFLIFGLIALWLHRNRLGLMQVDEYEESRATQAHLANLVEPSAPDKIVNRLGGGNHRSDHTAELLPGQAEREEKCAHNSAPH